MIAASTIMDLSLTNTRSSSTVRTEPYDIHATGLTTGTWRVSTSATTISSFLVVGAAVEARGISGDDSTSRHGAVWEMLEQLNVDRRQLRPLKARSFSSPLAVLPSSLAYGSSAPARSRRDPFPPLGA
jgi:hypothetical protein